MPQIPLLPFERNLPNQLDIAGPVARTGTANIHAAGSLTDAVEVVRQAHERVQEERRKIKATELLSEASVTHKAAVFSPNLEDPDDYLTGVQEVFKGVKADMRHRTQGDARLSQMVQGGLLQQEAGLADNIYSRHAQLIVGQSNAQAGIIVRNAVLESSTLLIEGRLKIGEDLATKLSSLALAPNVQIRALREFNEKSDEAHVRQLISGHPNNPNFTDLKAAAVALQIENTPFLPEGKRDQLWREVKTELKKAENEGITINKDRQRAGMSELSRMIMAGAPEAEVWAKFDDFDTNRIVDVLVDRDKVSKWIRERTDGVNDSETTMYQLKNEYLAGPESHGRIAQFKERLQSVPMNPQQRAELMGYLTTRGDVLRGQSIAGRAADIREVDFSHRLDNSWYTNLIQRANTYIDKLPMGVKEQLGVRYRELVDKNKLDPERAYNQSWTEIAQPEIERANARLLGAQTNKQKIEQKALEYAPQGFQQRFYPIPGGGTEPQKPKP